MSSDSGQYPQPYEPPEQPRYGQPQYAEPQYGQQPYGQHGQYGQPDGQYGQSPYPQPYGQPPTAPWQPMAGPIGRVRGTGVCILLTIVTLGFYTWYWFFQTHDEMKRHSGDGLGGGIALVLAIFVGIVMPYITSSEVGRLYERRNQVRPVSGATGLWAFPGVLILIGPIVWFVKTNGALNAYWRWLGAAG